MKINILKTNDLYLKAFKYISINSKSNTLPYHNMEHIMLVFTNAYYASNYYKINETLRDSAEEELCVAALFHDVNHSGGELTDSENISNSILSFESFWIDYNNGEIGESESKFRRNVIDIIEATEFPYKDMDLNIQQKIIRDCDMMSFNDDNHIYHYLFGMKEEFGIEDFNDQLKNQTKFILNMKLHTEWGRDKFDDKYGGLLGDLNFLSKVFKDSSFEKENEGEEMQTMTINGKKMHPYKREYIQHDE